MRLRVHPQLRCRRAAGAPGRPLRFTRDPAAAPASAACLRSGDRRAGQIAQRERSVLGEDGADSADAGQGQCLPSRDSGLQSLPCVNCVQTQAAACGPHEFPRSAANRPAGREESGRNTSHGRTENRGGGVVARASAGDRQPVADEAAGRCAKCIGRHEAGKMSNGRETGFVPFACSLLSFSLFSNIAAAAGNYPFAAIWFPPFGSAAAQQNTTADGKAGGDSFESALKIHEDRVAELIGNLSDAERAIAYKYLYASGMRIGTVDDELRKAIRKELRIAG